MKSAAFITGEGFQAENGGGNVFKIFEEYTPLHAACIYVTASSKSKHVGAS